jgi:hypothetical protein
VLIFGGCVQRGLRLDGFAAADLAVHVLLLTGADLLIVFVDGFWGGR